MKRLFGCLVVGLLAASLVYALPAHATTDVAGPIAENTTWTTENDPYLVKGNVQVLQTLTIEAGVHVEIRDDYQIDVAGKLIVEGEPGNPVVIDCFNSDEDCWKGIRFTTQSGSDIEGLDISGAAVAIDTNAAPWSVEDSHLHDNVLAADLGGLDGDETFSFDHNYVDDNATGVKIGAGLDSFELNTLTDNDTGVSFWTTSGEYSDNNIHANDDFNASTCDVPGTEAVNATENWWGTTTPASIESKFCDGRLEAQPANAEIDYEPFASSSIEGAATLEDFEPSPSASPSPSTSVGPPPPAVHSRTVTLVLRRHLRARGTATVDDGNASCAPTTVSLRYKRRPRAAWTVIRRPSVDPTTGAFAVRVRDRQGIYQATLPETAGPTDLCLAASSPKARHRH